MYGTNSTDENCSQRSLRAPQTYSKASSMPAGGLVLQRAVLYALRRNRATTTKQRHGAHGNTVDPSHSRPVTYYRYYSAVRGVCKAEPGGIERPMADPHR